MSNRHNHANAGGYSCGILIASTKGSLGLREDTVGPELKKRLEKEGYTVKSISVVKDDRNALTDQMVSWIDDDKIDLVLTSGGTGLSPNDVTPEASMAVIEREIPGLAEAVRAAGRSKTPHADLSRGVAGVRRESLIINLPGSPKGAIEGLETVLPALPHALDKIKGDTRDCAS